MEAERLSCWQPATLFAGKQRCVFGALIERYLSEVTSLKDFDCFHVALQLFAFCYHEKSRVLAGRGSAEKMSELYMREKGIFILSRRQFYPEEAACSRQEWSPLPSVCCQRAPPTGAQRRDTCQSEHRVRVLHWFSASSDHRGWILLCQHQPPQPFIEGDKRTDESGFHWPVSHQATEPGLAKNSQ